MIAAGSLLMFLSAQVTVPAGPLVPITLQTLAIPIIVALMGRELGTLAVLAYLAEGAIGWPVFAQHAGGILIFMGPSGGYLIGFPVAAYIIGTFYHDGFGRSYGKRLVAIFVGTGFVFVTGTLWLALNFTHHDLGAAIVLGILPFLVGDIAKCVVAAAFPARAFR